MSEDCLCCSGGGCNEGVESSGWVETICRGALIWGRFVVFFLRNETMPFAFSDMLAWWAWIGTWTGWASWLHERDATDEAGDAGRPTRADDGGERWKAVAAKIQESKRAKAARR